MLPQKKSGGHLSALIEFIERAVAAQVDLLQIRERDLPARDLFSLVDTAVRIADGSSTRVLVNDRADIAASTGAGVHLRATSLSPEVVRETFGEGLLVGASTHSVAEAEAAEVGGADFIVLGPVFQTESKRMYGPPLNADVPGMVASRLAIPMLALGGIQEDNFLNALAAGAAGIAGISIFAMSENLDRLVKTIKRSGNP